MVVPQPLFLFGLLYFLLEESINPSSLKQSFLEWKTREKVFRGKVCLVSKFQTSFLSINVNEKESGECNSKDVSVMTVCNKRKRGRERST